ncbi:uncharacterized protein TNCV_2695851 [Trichonephila clavipes]|nr:uncharacterized protein TNCV_2695851 [Trichonephila clavipes]
MSSGTVQAGGGSVIVWGVCSWRDMGPLIRLNTTLTGAGTHFHWPPKSPDMDIIEYICDASQHAVQKRSPLTLISTDLWTGLQDSWSQLPPALLQTLIESIPRRVVALLRARTAIQGFSSGRPRGTTPADDRYIVLQARRNRRQTAGEIARHTTQATGRPISRFTVARRLHGGGLFAHALYGVYL